MQVGAMSFYSLESALRTDGAVAFLSASQAVPSLPPSLALALSPLLKWCIPLGWLLPSTLDVFPKPSPSRTNLQFTT